MDPERRLRNYLENYFGPDRGDLVQEWLVEFKKKQEAQQMVRAKKELADSGGGEEDGLIEVKSWWWQKKQERNALVKNVINFAIVAFLGAKIQQFIVLFQEIW